MHSSLVTSLVTPLALAAALLTIGCGTTIRFDLIRPARVTSPGPGTPYQVIGFEVPAAPAAAPTSTAFAQPGMGQPAPSGGVVVVMPVPAPVAAMMGAMRQPVDSGPYEVMRLDASAQLAQHLAEQLAWAIQASPSPNQVLVPERGRVLVGGQILESSYVETEDQRHTSCDHEVTDRAGRTRTERAPCLETARRADASERIRLRVWTVEGQSLFDEELSATASVERTGQSALDGTWARSPEPIEPQEVLGEASLRLVIAAQRVLVPWRQPVTAMWRDASGYPEHDRARELAGEGHFEDSLALLDVMLGTTGGVRARNRHEASLLANRSVLRLARGRYEEALTDMEAAVHQLPGCVAGDLLSWTRQIVGEQGAVRAQGMTQPMVEPSR